MNSRPTAMEAIAADPAKAGLVLDFDGVLSPIIEDPTASVMPAGVASTLSRLVRRLGLVAVISGRPLDFLAERVSVPGIPLLGSYGIEQIRADGRRQMDPHAEAWLEKVREASWTLGEHLAGLPGIRIERKPVSVAVHWRQAPDQDVAADLVRRVTREVAADTGLRLEPGKLVEELRPPIDVDKGSAVVALLAAEKPKTIAYAGDDLGDIPALDAVRAAGGYALVVGNGPETDTRLLELADQTYAGSEAFAEWLAELADVIGALRSCLLCCLLPDIRGCASDEFGRVRQSCLCTQARSG
jgi:trehalose 6-phosphate phosphatase